MRRGFRVLVVAPVATLFGFALMGLGHLIYETYLMWQLWRTVQ